MDNPRSTRRSRPSRVAMLLVAAVVALATSLHAGPASAATFSPLFGGSVATTPISVNGDYVPLPLSCAGSVDIVWYGIGAAADARWLDVDWSGPTTSFTRAPLSVSGEYRAVTGDFDGDGCDDIFWYATGSAPDYVWYFASDNTHTSVQVDVGGNAVPVVGHFSAGPAQDIFWYQPGSAPESIWAGNTDRSFTPSSAPQVNGTYWPVTYSDGAIIWYAPGSAPDYVMWPLAGSTVPAGNDRTTINGTYRPFSLGGVPVLYAPGPVVDHLVTAVDGAEPVTLRTVAGAIGGDYQVGASGSAGIGVLHVPGPGQDYLMLTEL